MASTSNQIFQCLALLILAVEATAATARLLPNQNPMRVRHEQWMAEYGRTYKDDAEKEYRLKIFEETVKLVESHNSGGNSTYELAVNEFADLTMEEFIATYAGELDIDPPTDSDIRQALTHFKYENEIDAVAPSVDWTAQGAVTPVKGRFQCGKIARRIHKNTVVIFTYFYIHASKIVKHFFT